MAAKITSAEDRRVFLTWLAGKQRLKDPAAHEVINFFLSPPEHLERLRVIQDCSYLRPLLVIAAHGQRQPGLLFQTETGSCHEISVILMELSLTDEPVYLAAYFPHRSRSRLFQNARGDGLESVADYFDRALIDLETTQLLASLAFSNKRSELMLLIDQSLERQDRASFLALVSELKKLPDDKDLAQSGKIKNR